MSIGKLSNATAASLTSSNGTFALAAGMTLEVIVDGDVANGTVAATSNPPYGGDLIQIAFAAADFVSIGAATATEVVAVLNREFAKQAAAGQPAAAIAAVSGSAVNMKTVGLGARHNLNVVGGTACAILGTGFAAGQVASGTGLGDVGAQPSAPIFHSSVSFTGDSSYPTGGTLAFGAAVQKFFGDGRQVIGVIAQDCGGYVVAYVPGTDALKVYDGADSVADQPLDEVDNGTNLSGVTFNLIVLSV